MAFDGSRDDPTTRPMPAGNPPSPYGGAQAPQPYPGAAAQPYGQGGDPGQPYGGNPTQQWNGPPTQLVGATPGLRPDGAPAGQQPPGSPQPPRPRRRGWRSPAFLIPAVIGVLLILGAGAAFVVVKLRGPQLEAAPSGTPSASGSAASMPAGRTWLSGAWTGGGISVNRINAFGSWRGQPADVVTTYPAYNTWDELKNSDWHVGTLDAFKGRLSYGLPLLPKHDNGSLTEVAAGKYDDVWKAVATILNKHHRGDSFIRIGLEANGDWFPWGSGADRADHFKAAFRHVETVMKGISPKLVFGFDITCGHVFSGSNGRLDSLTKLYPGDDAVDIIGCDHYDSYFVMSRNKDEWQQTLRPKNSAGLADVADFARAHKKKLAIPEWGVTSSANHGAGDNAFFIYSMYQYFQQNKDILAYENYFNEAATTLGSAIWDSNANPKSAAEYKKLWSAAPTLSS